MTINALFNGMQDESFPGWCLSCPKCNEDVFYTVLTVAGGREPFLYCDSCSNFVLRREDADRVAELIGDRALLTTDQQRSVYAGLEQQLPSCPCGGNFKIWSNVKCPTCDYEFPYNNGVKDEGVRFFDSKIIWVKNAIAFRGANAESNRLINVMRR
jgi:hypothetical protein